MLCTTPIQLAASRTHEVISVAVVGSSQMQQCRGRCASAAAVGRSASCIAVAASASASGSVAKVATCMCMWQKEGGGVALGLATCSQGVVIVVHLRDSTEM